MARLFGKIIFLLVIWAIWKENVFYNFYLVLFLAAGAAWILWSDLASDATPSYVRIACYGSVMAPIVHGVLYLAGWTTGDHPVRIWDEILISYLFGSVILGNLDRFELFRQHGVSPDYFFFESRFRD